MAPVVQNDSLVEVAYTLKDDSGAVLESTEGARPFIYVHGRQRLLPALEETLAGMQVGDETDITLAPAQAYGDVDPIAFTVVAKDELPPAALQAGTELTARRRGETMFVTVAEVRDETVVLNLNHPLAGKTLHFHLCVLSVIPDPERR
jgi:FKBP-type peptidyl-prolyl cis-trans isomerase SlyD